MMACFLSWYAMSSIILYKSAQQRLKTINNDVRTREEAVIVRNVITKLRYLIIVPLSVAVCIILIWFVIGELNTIGSNVSWVIYFTMLFLDSNVNILCIILQLKDCKTKIGGDVTPSDSKPDKKNGKDRKWSIEANRVLSFNNDDSNNHHVNDYTKSISEPMISQHNNCDPN